MITSEIISLVAHQSLALMTRNKKYAVCSKEQRVLQSWTRRIIMSEMQQVVKSSIAQIFLSHLLSILYQKRRAPQYSSYMV